MKGIEKYKKIKEGAKKILTKVGTFLNKGAKVVDKIKPIVKVAKEFIPYGDAIDQGLEIGQNIAEKAGEMMQKIGEGKNVRKVIKEGFTTKKDVKTTNSIKQVTQENQNSVINFDNQSPEFLSRNPPKTQPKQPSFMNNILN